MCLKCENDCPGNLLCIDKRCVPKAAPNACPLEQSSGGSSSATSSNESTTSSAAGAGNGGSGGICIESDTCIPSILTPSDVFANCSDEPFSLTLEAGCRCQSGTRDAEWELGADSADGFALSKSGVLSGRPTPGTHVLRVYATVWDQSSHTTSKPITVHVSGCFVFFAEDDSAGGARHLAAARLDTDSVTELALPAANATLESFDVSPGGTYLGQVALTNGERRLSVFRIAGTSIDELDVAYAGNYVAHAFSWDSRWLALVTKDPDSSDEATLQLWALEDSVEKVDETSIRYESALAWSRDNDILYFGPLRQFPNTRSVIAHPADTGSVQEEIEIPGTELNTTSPFVRFIIREDGFLVVYTDRVVYVDSKAVGVSHASIEAVSPDLRWIAADDVVGVGLYPPGSPSDRLSPFETATDCAVLRAWSEDGASFMCTDLPSEGSSVWVYATSNQRGDLEGAKLNLAGGYIPFQSANGRSRVALSTGGRWLAMVPNERDGLFVVQADDFRTRQLNVPTLGPPEHDNYEWDFFFTSDQRRLVVQQGRSLHVAVLEDGSPAPEPQLVDNVRLPAVPPCNLSWFPDPDAWCGAPRFRGNLLLSRSQQHLAFVDANGSVQVLDLEATPLASRPKGTISASCTPDCTSDCAPNCLQHQ